MKPSLLLLALALILTVDRGPSTAAERQTPPFPTVTVFEAGKDGYNIFRIPAVIQAANSDLLVFCEARVGGDASEIDLVQKRSKDGGKTWGPLQVVQESDDFKKLYPAETDITVGNPAPVVDHLDPDHPGRIWLPFNVENDRVFVTHSFDDGATWSEPRDITADAKKDSWGWYATGPVHSIQLQNGEHRGRLVVPADHRHGDDGEDRGENGAQIIYSDDHGATWQLGAIDATYKDGLNANETTAVELGDGTLYINTRDQGGDAPGNRGEAWSRDGGETFESRDPKWKAFRPAPAILDPPVVQCSLIRAGDMLVFSGPDENGPNGKGRSDLRLRYSKDEAESWKDGPLIYVGPASYSDLVVINPATLGVLFECGEKKSAERIDFARVPVPSITAQP